MTETLHEIAELRRPLTANFVRKMTHAEICDLSEELFDRCLWAQGRPEGGELRKRLDLVNREGERRKLFVWR